MLRAQSAVACLQNIASPARMTASTGPGPSYPTTGMIVEQLTGLTLNGLCRSESGVVLTSRASLLHELSRHARALRGPEAVDDPVHGVVHRAARGNVRRILLEAAVAMRSIKVSETESATMIK